MATFFVELIRRFTSRRCAEINAFELSKCFMVFLVNGGNHLSSKVVFSF